MFIFDKLDDAIAYDGTIKESKPYQTYMKRKLKMEKSSSRSLTKKSFAHRRHRAQLLSQCTLHIHEIRIMKRESRSGE